MCYALSARLDADDVLSAARVFAANLGKLDANVSPLVSEIEAGGFSELSVRVAYAAMARHLPAIHHDLFDWLLVAQALFEPLHLLISDGHLPKYADLVILL
ncbi:MULTISPECIES: type II toxin-antitoxin system VapC family toxin [Mycetohabitans]|uniref:type II toxin-antitoxin system VapC family toxin n=1 Tax=Mycetohabitans TaxID=2571159 RepID=UPI0011B0EF38|nr:type II toxin-antitoxin system VapC family toxin [Mycetohabitans endofungorum]